MTEKVDRYLLLTWDGTAGISYDDAGYGHVELDFIYLGEDRKPRNFSSDAWTAKEQGDYMADLHIHSQINLERDKVPVIADIYGWSISYRRPFTVDLQIARAMVRTLGKIDRYLDKQTIKYDYPQEYITYIQRIAYSMKVKGILTEVDRERGSSYTAGVYKTQIIGDLRYAISSLIGENVHV